MNRMNINEMHVRPFGENDGVFIIQRDFFPSVLVFLLCVSISVYYISQTPVISVFRYGVAILCALYVLLEQQYIPLKVLMFLLCCLITGLLNIHVIGNATYPKLFYTLLSVLIAKLLCNPRISVKCLLYAIYLHAVLVAFFFLRYGLNAVIYDGSSNNYVSVLLLLPTVIYYSLLESRKERIPLMTAFVVLLLSLLAMGRGGIFSTVLLFTGLSFYSRRMVHGLHRMIRTFSTVILLFAAVLIISMRQSVAFLIRFNQFGISDHGRFAIWRQYLSGLFFDKRYLWLGVRFTDLPLAILHKGNLHNSFLNVHAFNGLIMSVFVFYLMVCAVRYGIQNRKWVFLICMATLFARGFTDQMFWGTLGTPFMFYFLFRPQFEAVRTEKPDSRRVRKSG